MPGNDSVATHTSWLALEEGKRIWTLSFASGYRDEGGCFCLLRQPEHLPTDAALRRPQIQHRHSSGVPVTAWMRRSSTSFPLPSNRRDEAATVPAFFFALSASRPIRVGREKPPTAIICTLPKIFRDFWLDRVSGCAHTPNHPAAI